MKRIIFITLLVAALTLPLMGQGATRWNIYQRPTSDWFSAGSPRDIGWQWAMAIDRLVAAGGQRGTGNALFVDSNVTNAGDGSSWSNAVATLDEAVDLCDPNDFIYVAQGHAEDWDSTDSVDIDVAGLTIIGFGTGTDMPTFTYDSADSELVIAAANIYIYNLAFSPSVNQTVHAIEIEADGDGSVIDHCWFMDGEAASTDEFIDAIQPAALADEIIVKNCKFESYSSLTTHANTAIDLTAGVHTDWIITNNYFNGGYDEACIYSDNDTDLRLLLAYNTMTNVTSGKLGIDFDGAVTGWCIGNIIATDDVTTSLDPGSMFVDVTNTWCDVDIQNKASVQILTTSTGVDTYSASQLAQIQAETVTAIEADHLDHLAAVSVADEIVDSSFLADITTSGSDWSDFVASTDSLEAISDSIAAITDFRVTCEVNAGGTTHVIAASLSGFGTDYFNTGWRILVTYDAAGSGAAPEGEIRDIVDYDNVSDFTVGPAFSTAVTTGDKVMIFRAEDLNLDDITILGGSGSVFYVDAGRAGTPDVYEEGRSWVNAYTTIALAIAAASADNGDIIYLAAGHTETFANAQLTLGVAGVSIIGLGVGDQQPTIIFNHANASIDITAADILLENIKFETTIDDVLVGIDLRAGADGTHIKNCRFVAATVSDEFLETIEFGEAAVQDVIIEGCEFFADDTADATEAIVSEIGISDNTQIIGNTFIGSWVVAPIFFGQAHTNMLIKDNVVHNFETGQHAIELTGACTGHIVDNRLFGSVIGAILDPGNMICSGNLAGISADEQSIVIPLSADTSGVTEEDDGSNLERLEYLQNKVDDILAGIRMAGGSVGDVYYCDDGGSNGAATTWATASTTLQAANDLTSANVGDIVFIAPNHSETLTGSTDITLDTDGVTIIGIGQGTEQPQIDHQAAATSIVITGEGITIKNINFLSSTIATVIGIDISTAAYDITIEDCLFTDSGDFEFAITINLGADAERCTIRNCRFESITGYTGATSCIAITAGVIDRLIIEDCHIWGNFTNAGIYSTQVNTNALIKNNSITNNNSGNHTIELSGAMTGDLINNMLSADTYGSVLDPGSMRCFGNMQTVGIDAAAEDVPLVAGKSYARAMLGADLNSTQNLFQITGSPIIVTQFIGKCTVACGGKTTRDITVDADDTFDYDLSTAVDVDTIDAGGLLYFSTQAGESVLTILTIGASGSFGAPVNWWVEEGLMICRDTDTDGSTGEIEWYMIFQPVESGGEVIPQAAN